MTNESSARSPEEASLALRVASMPWSFTQCYPLSSIDFIREARRRGFDLDHKVLRELYRIGLLVPLVAIRARRVSPQLVPGNTAPTYLGGHRKALRDACASGRAQDLSTVPYKAGLKFETKTHEPFWWNGLLYSWFQLNSLYEFRSILARCTVYRGNASRIVRFPVPSTSISESALRLHRIAVMAVALEARYFPVLDSERIHLVGDSMEQWRQYVRDFDAGEMSSTLDYSAKEARDDAEFLLNSAHSIDPLGSSWADLVRRSPRDSWNSLKDSALLAMDLRQTAEILLRYYEDLSSLGHAAPLPDFNQKLVWDPLVDRLSSRRGTLDQRLMHLGISPHPRVVLALEGHSEAIHAPRVWKKLGLPDLPELVRFLNLGGTSRDLQKVAALAAAPLVGARQQSGEPLWWMIKPPTCFMVAADPENNFAPTKIDKTRQNILKEIKATLTAQGAEANDSDLETLVNIRTWSQSCYEFTHFTDEELADGIRAVHQTCNDWSRDELVAALAFWRSNGVDIHRVWTSGRWDSALGSTDGQWDHPVSKTELNEALWPTLEAKIERALADSDVTVPEIATLLVDAYHKAQRFRYGSFVLRGAKGNELV